MSGTNFCAQCGGAQIAGPDGVGRDLQGQPTPMLHAASRGFHSAAEDMVTLHFDCLPVAIEDAHRADHGAAIDAAKKGVRGDKLLAIANSKGFDADDETEYKAWLSSARKAG